MSDIDRNGLNRVGLGVGRIVRDYLRPAPYNRAKLFTVLNALAGVLGFLIAGTGTERKLVRAWFDECLDEQIADALDVDDPEGPGREPRPASPKLQS